MEIKLEINKCDPIKLTSFCTRKETIKQTNKDNLQNGREHLQLMLLKMT